MVFIFMDLPKGYKYIGAKNYLRRSISAYDVNNSKRDVTKDRPSDGYPEEAFIVDQSQPHVRSKSEYSLEKVGQKNHSEACTKLRPPILVVTKENEDKDAPATETKEMGNEESKASVAKQPDEAGNNAVPLETSDSKDTARKEQNADTKQMVSKQSEDVNEKKKKVAKERKGSVARERKASVVKENDGKETKVENGKVKVEESLLSEVGGLDEYELNEAGIAYMYGGKFKCWVEFNGIPKSNRFCFSSTFRYFHSRHFWPNKFGTCCDFVFWWLSWSGDLPCGVNHYRISHSSDQTGHCWHPGSDAGFPRGGAVTLYFIKIVHKNRRARTGFFCRRHCKVPRNPNIVRSTPALLWWHLRFAFICDS